MNFERVACLKTELSKRYIYPLELIKTGCHFLNFTRQNNREFRAENTPIRSLLVYCVERIGDSWIPINREYKPIGLSRYDGWAYYKEYPFLLIPEENIDIEYLDNNCTQKSKDCYYIFNDSTYPSDKRRKQDYTMHIRNIFFEGKNIVYGND